VYKNFKNLSCLRTMPITVGTSVSTQQRFYRINAVSDVKVTSCFSQEPGLNIEQSFLFHESLVSAFRSNMN